jgi:predicted GNAT family acetyltransferase
MELPRTTRNHVYLLDPGAFQPIVNVLVQPAMSADGTPRFEIQSQGEVVAMAGTNWRSPNFAEVYVYVHPRGRGRGWGKSVVSACSAHLLEERRRPLYAVAEGNESSRSIAEALGYVATTRVEFSAEGKLLQS